MHVGGGFEDGGGADAGEEDGDVQPTLDGALQVSLELGSVGRVDFAQTGCREWLTVVALDQVGELGGASSFEEGDSGLVEVSHESID
jgi:hypothetical protein